ncbi:MAG: efflux RND transporter periplasmic adaptor subunit [Pseudomonadota bacterium]
MPRIAAADEGSLRPVVLMTMSTDSVGTTRQFFGNVVARQSVDLGFQVGGQIVEFPAQEGEVIPRGNLIARLDVAPFELSFRAAQLDLNQAQRTFQRMRQLSSSVSEAELLDIETQVEIARLALQQAELDLQNSTLSAPFNALVASRTLANFSTVGPGTPIVRLHDMSELRIEIDVPEILFPQASNSEHVQFRARFPNDVRTYPLVVREFDAEASALGQSFRMTLALTGRDGVNPLPGSSVIVLATAVEGDAAMRIPASALRIGVDGRMTVMRFNNTTEAVGQLEELPITVEADRDGVLRVSDGLRPGDEIVRMGAHLLEDGLRVRRFEGFAR